MNLFNKKAKPKKGKELLLTKSVPFAVEEAYKSLRTNLIFSLPEESCKVIEITSANQNEGKSVTAINLAIALAKNGEKVILIDCDLRLATIAKKLKMRQKPGLTNLLFGLNGSQEVIYHHPCGIDVIPAGAFKNCCQMEQDVPNVMMDIIEIPQNVKNANKDISLMMEIAKIIQKMDVLIWNVIQKQENVQIVQKDIIWIMENV